MSKLFFSPTKGQIVKILGFMNHTVSLATTQFCSSSHKIYKWACIHSLKTYLQKKRKEAGFGHLAIVCQSLVYRLKFILLNLALTSLISSKPSPTALSEMASREYFTVIHAGAELRGGIFKLNTTDNWAWIMLCCGGCHMYCRILGVSLGTTQ